jgi:Flagellar transcriptional activator (FlhC)
VLTPVSTEPGKTPRESFGFRRYNRTKDDRSKDAGRTADRATKTVVHEVKEITLAIELVEPGARLPLLEAEASLSRDRLIQFHKESKGVSSPKGACWRFWRAGS